MRFPKAICTTVTMAGIPFECILMLGYALTLALIAFLLEWAGRHAHQRSVRVTAGFTYHREHDLWNCPQDQHLFPVFSDSAKGITIYRARAGACNACPSKEACTDSRDGREIQHGTLSDVESGMKRFHRAISLTLLALASLILLVELFRVSWPYPKIVVAFTLLLFWMMIQRRSAQLSHGESHI